jgi:hypothetical protein
VTTNNMAAPNLASIVLKLDITLQDLPWRKSVRATYESCVAHLDIQRIICERQPTASGRISEVSLRLQIPETKTVAPSSGVKIQSAN